ncbi:GntR family transcriptional regulator [Alkalihalobacillus sp. BA299]|uniref:GntR family transcriptional regulator n=1 Tax=Alkalihalobacillus sp. BA299 TaxID=2815938 RepID=UPI001ADCD28B|nr:GntR family transcriptional regulator [Alkalihalobacillus sp. BA299]
MQLYRTKKEMIYQTIKEEILNGKYEFGEKLVISRIAERFGSSEIPVREAIRQLESDKLIEFIPHTGAVVSTISAKDIKEIFQLRSVLEGLATKLAVQALTDEHLERLRQNILESKEAFEIKDYERYAKLNIDFHYLIYSECNNDLLLRTIQDLWSNTKRYPSLFRENDQHIELSIQEHEEIYNALLLRDSDLAESHMKKHKIRAGEEILRSHNNTSINI